ncbi:MAG: hypothetical protein WDN06_20785 [Asticcacaulis sp.]
MVTPPSPSIEFSNCSGWAKNGTRSSARGVQIDGPLRMTMAHAPISDSTCGIGRLDDIALVARLLQFPPGGLFCLVFAFRAFSHGSPIVAEGEARATARRARLRVSLRGD